MVGALALAGCGAGQITQTSSQASGVGGASANVGQIAIREAAFAFTGDGKTAAIYQAGGEAPLTMTVVNFGGQVDKLTNVSSPAAESVRITGDATIASGRVLLVEGLPAANRRSGRGRSGGCGRPTRPGFGAGHRRSRGFEQATPAPGASAQATPAARPARPAPPRRSGRRRRQPGARPAPATAGPAAAVHRGCGRGRAHQRPSSRRAPPPRRSSSPG